MMRDCTEIKNLSHIHDACILLDSFFHSTSQVLQSIYYLEAIFFKLLYSNIDISSVSFSIPHIPLNQLSQQIIECNGAPIKDYENHLVQNGETFKVFYLSEDNGQKKVQLDKKYNVLNHIQKEKQSHSTFYVKENIDYASSFSTGKLDEPLINQYELSFILKELDSSLMLYFKIELHPSKQISSPFNRDFKIKFQDELIQASKLPHFRCNYESVETVLINASQELVFNIISNPKTYNCCELVVETDLHQREQIKSGDRFSAYMKLLQKNVEFEVIDNRYEHGGDCVFACRFVESQPGQTKFSFTFTIKSLNPDLQFLIFKNGFEQPMQPEFMKKHSSIKRATLKKFKDHAESIKCQGN